MKTNIEFIPYGKICSELTKGRLRRTSRRLLVSKLLEHKTRSSKRIFISFSDDLDDSFVEMFRKKETRETRLLIFNDISTDRLLSKILDLQIRSPERCYIVECRFGTGKSHFLFEYLDRFRATAGSNDEQNRIFDARIENDTVCVVSPDFVRLEIPISKIPQFKQAKPAEISNFEIDEDGSFIYWPDLDVHLGWSQAQQLIDPAAALKASQKGEEFNKRYGKAVQKLREEANLKRTDISGLSEKQLGRIEKGECRVTTNAMETLAKAHKLDRNEYMKSLAQALE